MKNLKNHADLRFQIQKFHGQEKYGLYKIQNSKKTLLTTDRDINTIKQYGIQLLRENNLI